MKQLKIHSVADVNTSRHFVRLMYKFEVHRIFINIISLKKQRKDFPRNMPKEANNIVQSSKKTLKV